MQPFINSLFSPIIIATVVLFTAAGIIWLFWNHGFDKLKSPEEWKDAGSSGEQTIYLYLRDKVHIPESQIFRNVYIPTKNGKTSEIDILVLSKKGLLVFECKNYSGNIYGDRNRRKYSNCQDVVIAKTIYIIEWNTASWSSSTIANISGH